MARRNPGGPTASVVPRCKLLRECAIGSRPQGEASEQGRNAGGRIGTLWTLSKYTIGVDRSRL